MQQIKDAGLTALTVVFTFLSPIAGVMFIVGAAIILDTATGIWKCKKTGVEVTSRGLQGMVSKMFFYQGVVVLLFCLDKFIMNDVVALVWDKMPFALTKIVALALVYIEILSIDENYEAVKGISIIGKLKKFIRTARKIKEDISDFKSDDKEKESEK